MVRIQINVPEDLNKFLEIQKSIHGEKDKRETVIRIIKERLEKEKELMDILNKKSEEV